MQKQRDVKNLMLSDDKFSEEIYLIEIYLLRKSIKKLPNKIAIRFSIILASMLGFVELVHRVF